MSSQVSTLSKWSMLLGNLFEHYDAALFSLLSPFLAPLFFPGHDQVTALILTYCIIPLGMMARPIGSLFFGYIGDTHGRKEALVMALMGMAIVTGCMGFLPTYQQAGFFAPVLLSIGRILQNFCAAGETMGGAIYLIENAPESEKDMTSSYYNASTVAGILIASFGVSFLCALDLVKECWRILYFLGCSTAIFAMLLRMKMTFHHAPASHVPSSLRFLLSTCWKNRQALVSIAVAAGFSYATYTLALVMMNGFIPLITSITKEEMMHLNTVLLGLDFLLLPFFGLLAKRYSREKMMIVAGALAAICGFPLFLMLQGATMGVVILVRFTFVVIGVWFTAPFYSWAQKLVPEAGRYTVLSFAYAIGSQLLGGPSAAISMWFFLKTEWVVSAALFWMTLGLLASFLIARLQAATMKLGQSQDIYIKNC